ncbi:MAG: radical SAM protein [Deltaproteobacteria bacterium]|nr:radical SAM protein [Deltaproteobacteria bacterium]
MKFTLSITQDCNLRCGYCYIKKKHETMPLQTARKAVDFIFGKKRPGEEASIGFFGGEPLLEFGLLKKIVSMIKEHPKYDPKGISFTVTTNGTIFDREIARYIVEEEINFCLSIDGPPRLQDANRRFSDGSPSSHVVERNIRRAIEELPSVVVNAVYTPATFRSLPEVVKYLAGLGLRRIYFNPDYSAGWDMKDAQALSEAYGGVADFYVNCYLEGRPIHISPLDDKIAVIMRNGYEPQERCSMGTGEFAISPSGLIYPCERLIGPDTGEGAIGSLDNGCDPGLMSCRTVPKGELNHECLSCTVRPYCMNWCGCSNYFSSGFYNRVSPFQCASEKALLSAAFKAFERLDQEVGAATFMEHFSGRPAANSCMEGAEAGTKNQ